jgi:hypothetical protein
MIPLPRANQVIFLLCGLMAWAGSVEAHPIPDIPVRAVFPGDGSVRVMVEVNPRCFDEDPAIAPSLLHSDLEGLSEASREELKRRAAELVRQWIEFTFEPRGRVQPEFLYRFSAHGGTPLAAPDDVVVLTGEWHTMLAEGLSGWWIRSSERSTLAVTFQNTIRGSVHPRLPTLFPGEKSFTLDISGLTGKQAEPRGHRVPVEGSIADLWSTLFGYLRQGFAHVFPKGVDHLLFVIGLFLMGRAWRSLLAQVAAFTLAHSITLALASFGLVKVPSSITEPIIAASIAFVAVENLVRPKYTRWRLLVVFIFGLVHGLGFASALNGLDLPRSLQVVGLLGFNLGVECGQLAAIGIVFLLTGWIREPERFRVWVTIPGSIAIALCGVVWMAQRLL